MAKDQAEPLPPPPPVWISSLSPLPSEPTPQPLPKEPPVKKRSPAPQPDTQSTVLSAGLAAAASPIPGDVRLRAGEPTSLDVLPRSDNPSNGSTKAHPPNRLITAKTITVFGALIVISLVVAGGYAYRSSNSQRTKGDDVQSAAKQTSKAEAQARSGEDEKKELANQSNRFPKPLKQTADATQAAEHIILPPSLPVPQPTSPPEPASGLPTNDAESLLRQMLSASERNSDTDLLELAGRINALQKPPEAPKGMHKSARALNTQGLAQLADGTPERAVVTFRQAATLDPAVVEFIDNLGFALVKTGDYKNARAASFSALALAPSRSSAWASLGIALAETEGEAKAVAAFANAYRFSRNAMTTVAYLENLSENDASPKVRAAAKRARALVPAVIPQ